MEPKSVTKSWTMIFNVLVILASIIQGLTGVVENLDENSTIVAGALAVINAGLRLKTKQPVKL